MRILLDECLPRPLKRDLLSNEAVTVTEMQWSGIENGNLLRLAETQFDVFLTVDSNLPYQHNMSSYDVAIVVIAAQNNKIDTLRPFVPKILEAMQAAQPGSVSRVTVQADSR
jgi:predicted nuclease of predicted toxin-antitoxin system